MSRSQWKLLYLPKALVRLKDRSKTHQPLIWQRSAVIPHFLVGTKVKVHSGKDFVRVRITEDTVGYKFGEFVFTRKSYQYKGKKKTVKKKK